MWRRILRLLLACCACETRSEQALRFARTSCRPGWLFFSSGLGFSRRTARALYDAERPRFRDEPFRKAVVAARTAADGRPLPGHSWFLLFSSPDQDRRREPFGLDVARLLFGASVHDSAPAGPAPPSRSRFHARGCRPGPCN